MTIDDLKKECRYCYREIDNSGLEGFRCANKNVIKTKGTSWCLPKCADQPCSTCAYREIKDDNECLFYETCSFRSAVCKVQQPDNGCLVYRYFKELIVKDYENRLKADLKAILTVLELEIEEKVGNRDFMDKKIQEILQRPDRVAYEDDFVTGYNYCLVDIQQRIDALKGGKDAN